MAINCETLQQKTAHKGRKIANYRISRGRRVLLGTMAQMSKVDRNTVFTFVVLHSMLRTLQGGAVRLHDLVTLQNEQVVYMPNENYRNLLR